MLWLFSATVHADDGFKSLTDIEQALNPLDVVANHGGIRRSIDLDIAFALNSDQLLPQTLAQLEVLGKAMNSDRLINYRFQIIGHTDAQGDASYNQSLSERRADSVAQYLAENIGIDVARMDVIGKGETALKDKLPPNSATHRRVEIVALDTTKPLGSGPQKQHRSDEWKSEPEKNADGTLKIDW